MRIFLRNQIKILYLHLPTDFLNIPVDENVIVWSEIFNRCDKFFTKQDVKEQF